MNNTVEIRSNRIFFKNTDSVIAVRQINERFEQRLPQDVFESFLDRVVSTLNATTSQDEFYAVKAEIKALTGTANRARRDVGQAEFIRIISEWNN